MNRILIAEDEERIASFIEKGLRASGFTTTVAADGGQAIALARSGEFDLLILDLGLPGRDGFAVLRALRESDRQLPVVILTARGGVEDTVAGLDGGADDYVTKPFRLAELLARVRALLRRGSTETPIVQGVRIDAESRRAWMGDHELQLTTKEFDLLRVLVRDAGKVVTREQIMREVWDTNWWGSTKTLDMHISWLRRKLGDDAGSPRYITTVRGVGFRFERGD
jgi:DNA-binding response OmpR family regulator